jgi:hypothetical protein
VKTDLFWIVLSLVFASLVTAALVVGEITLGTVLFVTAGLVVTVRVAPRIAIENDRKWITTLLPLAFVAKMGGSIARYLMVTEVYGSGDSFGYYNRAIQLVHTWRSYDLPETTFGGSGTRFVDLFTSFLFVPSVPTFLFAFLLFATLSFIGLIFFYLAFRRWFRDDPKLLLLYAGFVFFMPSLLFWPSSIGKDAIMVFALGIAAYGGARVLEGSYLKGAAVATPGLLLAAAIRPHVATLVVASLVFALLLSGQQIGNAGWFTRLIALGIAVAVLSFVGLTAAENLNVETTGEGLDVFLEETERRTAQGGSVVTGNPVNSPLDLPEATLRVLFRPLPHEAGNAAALVSSAENVLLMILLIARLPTIARNIVRIRFHPYMLFVVLYTVGFVIAFSAIFNLGILTRQRVQVLPFLLAALVGLGWGRITRPGEPSLQDEMPATAAAGSG